MIIPALLLAAIGSPQDFLVPVEASPEYRKLATSIEDALVEKNFEKGAMLVAQLPRANATFHVDMARIPAAQRLIFAADIAGGAMAWKNALEGAVNFTSSNSLAPDITFTIAGIPSPSWNWSTNAAPAKFSASLPSNSASLSYNSRLTFAKYLGLATISRESSLTQKDVDAAKRIVNLSRLLQDAIQSMAPDFQVPAGASSEFHHLVLDIEKALDGKDFAIADQLSARLPKSKVTWSFDNSKLNADQKEQFLDSMQGAIDAWSKVLGGLVEFKPAPKGKADISVSFEPVLAKIAGTKEVAGAAFFLAGDSSLPQIEAVIGLKRGSKLESVLAREVYNECLFTIGRYLGLAPNPQIGPAMGRIDGAMANANQISQLDNLAARKNVTLSTQLRIAIQKRQTIEQKQPILSLEKANLEFSPQFQGDQGRASMLVTNTGTSTLELEIKGDCGCIGGEIQSTILPGKSAILTGKFDTIELTGDVHHNLILRTNDPDRPVMVIPVSITVTPRAEVVYSGTNTAFMDQPGRSFTFYVNSADPKLFKVIEASVLGMPLTAKAEPFEGEVSNFQRQGKIQKVRGYKVTVDTSKVPTEALFGRMSVNVYLRTDDPKVGLVKTQMFIQKGIVSLPEAVYLGSPQGVADSNFVVTRLGRPFVIKKISSDSKNLTFEISPNAEINPSAYTIRVIYDGKAPGHRLKGIITIETDDTKQQIIKVPYQTS
jgi:hypothetical protein